MVSILGDYSYSFPPKQELKLKLKDMLEDNVDEKYYLSDKQIHDVQNWQAYEKPLDNMEKTEKNNISPTLTTRSGAYAAGMILIKNANSKGYLEAEDGDGVDISGRMEYHRGTVQKGKTQTLSTKGGENNGVVVGMYQYAKSDKFMQGKDRLQVGKETSDTLQTSPKEGVVNSDLRIRKLTSRECGRLMNVKDEDIDKILKNQSDSSAYHLFGDSICTNCLMAIFGELLDINWKQKLEEMLYGNTN